MFGLNIKNFFNIFEIEEYSETCVVTLIYAFSKDLNIFYFNSVAF